MTSDNTAGAVYDLYKQVGGPMLKALGADVEPDERRAALVPPHHLVNPAGPKGWAPVPTLTVDVLHLEAVLKSLWRSDATSWISPDGLGYVVPGRHNRDTQVQITGTDPRDWICGCAQSHQIEHLCYPVLQVALLRGTLIRRRPHLEAP